MDYSIKSTLSSSKNPYNESLLSAQENLTNSKEKVKYFNKAVKSMEPSISFKLQLNEREQVEFCGSLTEKGSELTYIPIRLAEEKFHSINGNLRDEPLAALISKECLKKEISFTILAKPHSSGRKYTPETTWQKRFIKCIEDGMVSFMKEDCDPDAIRPNTGGMKQCEYYGTRKLPSTCSQFARYLMLGATSYYSGQYRVEIPQPTCIYKQFSPVSIFDDYTAIHEFIHIAEGVCLSKIGSSSIYFHTSIDILKLYEKAYDKSLCLRTIEYIDDF